MPNWKKLVVSGSDSHLNSLKVTTYVSASDFSGGNFSGDGSRLENVEGITKFIVTVENRGSGNKYIINDQYAPELTFFPGDTYVFDLSDSSNANHPLAFRLPDDTSYSYNVTQSGTPGNSGAETRISVDYQTSGSLKYYCTVHGNSMGNLATVLTAYDAIISGSFSGSFQGDGSGLTNLTFNGTGLLSSSAQIASDISGSITEFSASITDRVTELEISGSDTADSASFSARITNNEITGSDHESRLDTLEGKTLLSSSLQIAEDISGSFTLVSESFASERLKNTTDTLTGDLTVTGTITAQEFHTEFVSSSIIFSSGSTKFGDTQDDNHNFTGSVNITGSVTALEFNGIFQGALSSSAQIASDISGSITEFSSSIADRVTELEISGSDTSLSSSLALRVANNEATGSDHENRLDTLEGKTLLSSSAQIADDISGSFVEPSSSFSTRITDLESFSSSLDDVYATDADLNIVSASVDGLLAATSSYALSASISGAFTSVSSSIASDIEDIIDGTTTVASSSYAFTASYALNAGSTLTISGSDVGGTQVDSSAFTKLQFDSSTGLNVESIDSGATALVSIGSHFRDIIVDGQTTLVATGSDQLELVTGTGVNITTSTSDTNANSVSKEISFSVDDTIATTGSNVFVGDQIITGSLITTLGASGSFSGSFEGNGSGLTGIVTSSYALTASYALNAGGGGSTDTGSLLVTASAAGSTITFEKGDGSTFDVLIAASASSADALVTASISGNTLTFEKGDTSTFSLSLPTGGGYSGESATAHHTQSVSSVTWSFNHQLGDRLPAVTVYDSNYDIIIPNKVNAVDDDNLQILFTTARTGYATAVVVGASSSFASTASYIESSNVDGPLGMDSITSASYALTASYADSFNVNKIIVNQITASVISASYIDLDVLADGDIPPHKAGRIFFSEEDGALSVYNEEADITLQLGQEFYIRAFNPTGNTILNGTPVRASGSQGDRIAIYPALAEDHTTGIHFDSHIIGLATHNIGPSTEGYVTAQGIVRGIDTQAFSAGDTLYLQTGSAGLRNSPPPFPYDIVQVGYASRIGSNGFVFVEPKEPVHFSNISGLSGSYVVEPGELWVYQSNNAWTHTKTLSGSYVIDNGGLTANSFTGSLLGTASYADNADSLDGLNSSQFLRNDQTGTLTGDLTVTGTITAQEFHTEFVSASIIYQSGSTQFGNSADDTHVFSGSLNIDGAVTADFYTGIFVGAISSSVQIATEISGAFVAPSSSFSTRVTDLESFSSSLDATFATDADLNIVSASVDGLLAATSSYALKTEISGAFDSISSSLALRITNQEAFSSSLDATFATDADLNLVSASVDSLLAATSSYALSSSISGAFDAVSSSIASDIEDIIDGTQTVTSSSYAVTASYIDPAFISASAAASGFGTGGGGGSGDGFPFVGDAVITGSLFVSGGYISGSFKGDGSQLTGIDVGSVTTVGDTFTSQTQVVVTHNFNSRDINVVVYNDSNELIIPDGITLTTLDTVTVDFAVATSGRIVVSKGGHIITALGLSSKAGTVQSSSFSATGSSFYYDVTFDSAFSSTNYTVGLQAHSKYTVPSSFPGHAWVDSNKATTGFRIVVPSFDDTTDEISWTAIAHGESDVSASSALTASYVEYSNVANKPTLVSSSLQLATEISGSFTSISASIASNIEDIIDGTTLITSASKAISSSFAESALTASYALNAGAGSGFPFSGSAIITGSLLVSGSIVDFTDAIAISGSSFSGSFFGDGTGLSGLGYGDTKKLNQTVAATTWSFSHNMNEQFPTVTVYNDSNEVIQPTKIEGVDAQTLKLYFGVATAGTAVAVVGGTATTQEAGFNRVLSQTSAATTWSFAHNLGNKYPQVIVYDSNDEFILPGKVEAVDQNNLNIYFDTAQSGTATATVGGTSLTASYADSLVVTDTLLSTQENTDVDTGTETVATVSTTYYDGAFFDYVAKDGTNYRAGTVMAVWDGSSVQYADNSTADIGDTSGVTLAVDINGTDARLRATTTSDNWNIKAFIRAL